MGGGLKGNTRGRSKTRWSDDTNKSMTGKLAHDPKICRTIFKATPQNGHTLWRKGGR